MTTYTPYSYATYPNNIYGTTYPAVQYVTQHIGLTEEQVRKIIREELEALKEPAAPDTE